MKMMRWNAITPLDFPCVKRTRYGKPSARPPEIDSILPRYILFLVIF